MSEVDEKQIKRLRNLLIEAETNLLAAKELLISLVGDDHSSVSTTTSSSSDIAKEGMVVEGVFDGQNMIGSNSKIYPVSANYASKSHVLQGDVMKLTIEDGGKLKYKIIGPQEAQQVVGRLVQREGNYYVESEGKEYKILLASVTFFKLKIGDEVTILIPKNNPSVDWAAVEAAL